ncbi:MAG: fibronectin type III domain-containing protein [Treponema sp.]|jgi:formylglycine-generating enzyme required for sulfatase activity|nr:fibronectin type III domain-containing protein [Treponema sp.]
MKRQLSIKTGIIAVVLGIFLLAGCNDMFSPSSAALQENPSQGMVTINIGNMESSRTLFPEIPAFSRYKLQFQPLDGQSYKGDMWVNNTTSAIGLDFGQWRITAIAYVNISGVEGIPDDEYEAARGSEELNVTSYGYDNYVTIDIHSVADSSKQGVFDYSPISFPASVYTAELKIFSLTGAPAAEVIDLLDNDNTGSLVLDSNYYILRLELENNDGKIIKFEVIHIYPGLTTITTEEGYTFVDYDFVSVLPVPNAPNTPELIPGENYISVSWNAVDAADSYDVQYREDNEAFQYYGSAAASTSVTINNLKSGTKYYVRVRARNLGGPGAWSSTADATTIAVVPETPSAPAVTAGSAELTVSWSAVSYAIEYEVWYRTGNSGNGQQFLIYDPDTELEIPITQTSIIITGLNNGVAYQVRIKAINDNGSSDFSEWSVARTTDSSLPPAPAMPVISNVSFDRFKVEWQSVALADAYSVWLTTENNTTGAQRKGGWVDAADPLTMNIDELNPGTTYYIWVRARNADGVSGAFSPSAKCITTLPAPLITNVTGGKRRLTVSWRDVYIVDEDNIDITSDPYYNSSYPVLQNDVWYDDSNPVKRYQFYAKSGATYAVQWNDSYQGNSTKSADIGVSAYWADSSGNIFSRTDSGYNPPQTFTAYKDGIVILLVEYYSGGDTTGTYALRYTKTSNEYADLDGVQYHDIYLSTDNYWDIPTSYSTPTKTVTGVTSTTIDELTPNQTYYIWVRGKNYNNGEWVYSDWSSQSSRRVPNNQTALTNFRLNYDYWTNYYGTFEGNLIRLTVPYERSLTSAQTYFDLSSGASASISSGSYQNFTAPKDIIVTAEDGETTAEYTVIVKVNTPVQINFAGPDDESVDIDASFGAYTTNEVSFNMAAIPGGTMFPTGISDTGSAMVSAAYQIAETQVTWELWNTVRTWAVANGYSMSAGQRGSNGSGSDQQPVTMVSWYDSIVWCNALTEYWNEKTGTNMETVYNNSEGSPIRNSGDTGVLNSVTPSVTAQGFRLPTSNEWELAARWRNDNTNTVAGYSNPWFTKGDSASGATASYSNVNVTHGVAVTNSNSSGTAAVKSKLPNALGLYDMSGNVWEVCFDRSGSSDRVTRGGAWSDDLQYKRVGYVHNRPPAQTYNNHGFRLVRNNDYSVNNGNALTLSAPSGYEGYKWIVDNVTVNAETSNYMTLDTSTMAIGPHSITLVIYKQEGSIQVPYSKTITITVTP